MSETCYNCGQDITDKSTEHGTLCPVKLKPLELECLRFIMEMEFCDHFCCGLPSQTCHAKTLAQWLQRTNRVGGAIDSGAEGRPVKIFSLTHSTLLL